MKKIFSTLLCMMMLLGACSCDKIFNFTANSGDSSLYQQSEASSEKEEVVTERIILKTKKYALFLQDTATVQKIDASVYADGKLMENAEVVYEVENPTVAEVLQDGTIVAKGTPEEVAKNPNSYTGHYIQEILNKY